MAQVPAAKPSQLTDHARAASVGNCRGRSSSERARLKAMLKEAKQRKVRTFEGKPSSRPPPHPGPTNSQSCFGPAWTDLHIRSANSTILSPPAKSRAPQWSDPWVDPIPLTRFVGSRSAERVSWGGTTGRAPVPKADLGRDAHSMSWTGRFLGWGDAGVPDSPAGMGSGHSAMLQDCGSDSGKPLNRSRSLGGCPRRGGSPAWRKRPESSAGAP